MMPLTVGRRTRACLLSLFAFLGWTVVSALAQTEAGSIAGTLTDPSGSVLKGAQVSIVAQTLNTVTDQQGRFYISGLAPGTYTLTFSYVGFKTLTKEVTVNGGQA